MNNTEHFLTLASQYALNSTCYKRHVGAVIVVDEEIIAYGINGSSIDYMHCRGEKGIGYCYWKNEANEIKKRDNLNIDSDMYKVVKSEEHNKCLSICAEQKAILNAYKKTNDLSHAIMYCTTFPCTICAKIIRQSKIKKIYYIHDFDINDRFCLESKRILDEANVIQIQCDPISMFPEVGKRTTYIYTQNTRG